MDFRIFAITISPPPRRMSPKYAYNEDKYVLERWLNSFSRHWILYPEFSKESRLHYHGIVRMDDKIKFHKTKYRIDKTVGFVKVEELKKVIDHFRWLIYCQKEYADTSRLLKVFMRRKIKTRNLKNQNNSPSILDWFPQNKK